MFFFFKQKTAYEMRISDWSSDVCSSDLDAARSITADHSRQCRPVPAVLLVDVLNDFFAALVFEVHVDIGRFLASLADEAGEQGVAVFRIDFGDAQAITDGGVGRRDTPLAKNVALFC